MRNKESPEFNVAWKIKDVIFIFIACLIFIFVISLLFLKVIKRNPFVGAFFLSIFVIILVNVFLHYRNEKWSRLGFVKKNSGKLIIQGIAIGAILFFITKLIFRPFSYIELFASELTPLKIFKCFLILVTFKGFVDIVLIPFIEEILFRGLFFQALLNKFNRLASIIIVSSFDSLTHVSSFQNYNWLLIRFIYFVCITWLFDRYRNLFMCISVHSTLNYLVWVIQIIGNN
ncbi:MAG: type II CAAX endopeptidase family protein [Candidatus Omnitrophota bacterium]|nr:type II CAAX endopeptidase family protein [Candidatus Omnitrophota bacterium]